MSTPELELPQFDRNELKIQALRQGTAKKVSDLVVEYEEQVSELRIELTTVSEHLAVYKQAYDSLVAENDNKPAALAAVEDDDVAEKKPSKRSAKSTN